MKTKLKQLTLITTFTAINLLPLPLLAGQFTVNSNHDPATGNPLACLDDSGACTLRDALAAADLDAQMDEIVFDIEEPIYLSRGLAATQPVIIDGGGTTSLRVDQGYSIKTLPDRRFFGDGDVLVMQPGFHSPANNLNLMLSISGAGSVVKNLDFDGSIRPDTDDLGVERIDYDANDTTDYILYTVFPGRSGQQARWPIAGGIQALATATISGNTFNNLRFNPVTVDFSAGTTIKDNVMLGDAVGNQGFSTDGIFFFGSINSVVSGNTISGFRNGVSFVYSSGLSIHDNELTGNVYGLELDTVGPDFGTAQITENTITDNTEVGVYVRESLGVEFAGNEVSWNLQRGFLIKHAGEITVFDNQVNNNGSGDLTHGGILVSEGSGYVSVTSNAISKNNGFGAVIDASFANELANNEIIDNHGAGIVLLNGAQWNQVLTNTVRKNPVGIISGLDGSPLFPSNNLFQENILVDNTVIDALDYDPVCNDAWIANTIGSSASVSAGCIEP